VSPLPQHCTLPAHEEASLPSSLLPFLPWLLPLRSPSPSPLQSPTASPPPLPLPIAVIVGHPRHHLCCIAVSHCCCRCPRCWPLPSPSTSAIAVDISVGHHRCRHHRPFPRVVALVRRELLFDQLKQRMLTIFYFVRTVGGTLIKAG
jgi:hypothetical protein